MNEPPVHALWNCGRGTEHCLEPHSPLIFFWALAQYRPVLYVQVSFCSLPAALWCWGLSMPHHQPCWTFTGSLIKIALFPVFSHLLLVLSTYDERLLRACLHIPYTIPQ